MIERERVRERERERDTDREKETERERKRETERERGGGLISIRGCYSMLLAHFDAEKSNLYWMHVTTLSEPFPLGQT